MKNPGGTLKELQKYWYKLLKDSGFQDIEELINGELRLKQSAAHNFCSLDPFEKEMEEEYFTLIFHKVNDDNTIYRNKVDKMILHLYANGATINEIVYSLKTSDIPRNRASVRYIIRKYEMAWNIKKYTPKQLNKKCS